jgi:uncharacterized protein DUF1203
MKIQIAKIPQPFLDKARLGGIDDQGQPVRRLRSEKGGEPCRDVLRRARAGEELILASFSPFALPGPFREFGPVFILAEPSAEPVRRDALPLPDGSTGSYLQERFVLRAYGADESILAAELVAPKEAQPTLERFLGRPEVAFVHARFPTYGCFACRIDRG